jgi:quercetin dioxygenase-like cupin family protein
MRPSSAAPLLAAFVLGACTTVAVQGLASSGVDQAPATATASGNDELPTVIPIAVAPRAIAPNGKGSITHLARGRNAYLGLLRMDPGGAVPSHRDPTEEYIHVLEGGGTMIIDGQSYDVTTGTTIYMPADAEVSFTNGDQALVAIQVFAGPEPAAKYETWEPAP